MSKNFRGESVDIWGCYCIMFRGRGVLFCGHSVDRRSIHLYRKTATMNWQTDTPMQLRKAGTMKCNFLKDVVTRAYKQWMMFAPSSLITYRCRVVHSTKCITGTFASITYNSLSLDGQLVAKQPLSNHRGFIPATGDFMNSLRAPMTLSRHHVGLEM